MKLLVTLVAVFCLLELCFAGSVINYGNHTVKCCNTCPKPKITIIPVIKYKVFPLRIPFPVFKPFPIIKKQKCPKGFKRIGHNKCIRTIKIKGRCPPGYFKVSDKTCMRVVVIWNKVPKTVTVCPPGFKPVGKIGCKKGKVIVPKTPKLAPWQRPKIPRIPKIILKKLKCPKGFKRKGKYHCVKVIKCPNGWKWKKGSCERIIVKCPPGYKKLGKRRCLKTIIRCPNGYKQTDKECVKTIIKIIKVKCPKGFIQKKPGICIPKRCYNVKCKWISSCPPGYTVQKPKGHCCSSCLPCRCPKIYKPVCGEDGVTYQNKCYANCLKKKIKYPHGHCKSPCVGKIKDKCFFVRCLETNCAPGWVPKKKKGHCCPTCVPSTTCPLTFKPVCGVNSITYQNACAAKHLNIKIKYAGKCKTPCLGPINDYCFHHKCTKEEMKKRQAKKKK